MTTPSERRRKQWGDAVRDRRLPRSMTQIERAEAVGVQQSAISQIERGEHSGSEQTRFELAKALGVEVHELFVFPSITDEGVAS
jgi:transcriptional regulator with XRE-family HTH domain